MILNLIQREKSDIPYEIQRFPDGQKLVKLITPFYAKGDILIISRLNNFLDLENILTATQAFKKLKVKSIFLYTPYVLGARSDRRFSDGECSYMSDVMAPIINSQGYDNVAMYDVHSDVTSELIKNSLPISNVDFVKRCISDIRLTNKNISIVSPDGGALKKIYTSVSTVEGDFNLIQSSKHRDLKTGKLSGFNVPLTESDYDSALVWVDDICDGGGTFIGEAEQAIKNGHKGKKYLVVSHGVFSNGLKDLTAIFDGIFTTNSYRDFSMFDEFVMRNEKYMNKLFVYDILNAVNVQTYKRPINAQDIDF